MDNENGAVSEYYIPEHLLISDLSEDMNELHNSETYYDSGDELAISVTGHSDEVSAKISVEITDDDIADATVKDSVVAKNDSHNIEGDISTRSVDPELEPRCSELEMKVQKFGEKFRELKGQVDAGIGENSELILSISNELSSRADRIELKKLRRDFDHFSKRLRRIVRSEDSLSAETLDAAKVPPDVLEITYAKTLNDLHSAMKDIFGEDESSEMVDNIRVQVRQFSAGVDFFRFDTGTFSVHGLSNAINNKLISVKQIHGTYVELFKLLSQCVTNYDSQDFRSFVETGSREYTVEKIVAHEKNIRDISSDMHQVTQELSELTTNMQFMAELQDSQLEGQRANQESINEMSEQIKAITKAINLHTKAIKKLNTTLVSMQASPVQDNCLSPSGMQVDLSGIESNVRSKADRDEVVAISTALGTFREEMNDVLGSMQQQLQDSFSRTDRIDVIQADIDRLREEISQPHNDVPWEDMGPTQEGLTVAEDPSDLIVQELCSLGSATLKQLERQINSNGEVLCYEDVASIVGHLEEEKILQSFKKGRYTYFSLVG